MDDDETITPRWVRENIDANAVKNGILLYQYQDVKQVEMVLPSAPNQFWLLWKQFDFDDPDSTFWYLDALKHSVWDWQIHPGSADSRRKNFAQWDRVVHEVCSEMHANETPWEQLLDPSSTEKNDWDWAVWGEGDFTRDEQKKRLISRKLTAMALEMLQELREMAETGCSSSEVWKWLGEMRAKGEEAVEKFDQEVDLEGESEGEEEDEEDDGEDLKDFIVTEEEEEEEPPTDEEEEEEEELSSSSSYSESEESLDLNDDEEEEEEDYS